MTFVFSIFSIFATTRSCGVEWCLSIVSMSTFAAVSIYYVLLFGLRDSTLFTKHRRQIHRRSCIRVKNDLRGTCINSGVHALGQSTRSPSFSVDQTIPHRSSRSTAACWSAQKHRGFHYVHCTLAQLPTLHVELSSLMKKTLLCSIICCYDFRLIAYKTYTE